MSNLLPKGTQILCPRKRHKIGVLSRAMKAGEPLMVSRIDFEDGQGTIAGEPTACKLCSSLYYVGGKLYTADGWRPNAPQLEPVTRR